MAAHGAQDSQQAAPSPAESPVPLLQIAQLLLKTRAFCWAWRRSDLLEAVPKMANIQPAAKAPLELKPPEKVTCKDGGEPKLQWTRRLIRKIRTERLLRARTEVPPHRRPAQFVEPLQKLDLLRGAPEHFELAASHIWVGKEGLQGLSLWTEGKKRL